MSSIILPGRFYSQPQGPVEVDWANPLNLDLLEAHAPNRQAYDMQAATIVAARDGIGFLAAGGTGGVKIAEQRLMAGLDYSTALAVFDRSVATGNANGRPFYCERSEGNDIYKFGLGASTTSAVSFVFRNNAGNLINNATSVAINSAKSASVAAWVTNGPASRTIYCDRNFATNTSNFPNTFTYANARRIGGDQSDLPSAYTGYVLGVFLWQRALSIDELNEIERNPWQLFRAKKRVLYFDVGAGGAITAALNPAAETDTAQAINKVKLKAVGQASETNTVQPITRRTAHTVAVAQASTTDTAQAISKAKTKALGQATETDTVQALTARKLREVGQVVETNTAQNITPSGPKLIAVGQASETDFAQAFGKAKQKAIGLNTGAAETLFQITPAKQKAIGLLSDAPGELPGVTLANTRAVGLINDEAGQLFSITPRKRKAIGFITTADQLFDVTPAKRKAVGLVTGAEELLPLTAVGGATLALTQEDINAVAAAVWAHSTAVEAHAKLDAILARLQC